jgi:hypothetical protein
MIKKIESYLELADPQLQPRYRSACWAIFFYFFVIAGGAI